MRTTRIAALFVAAALTACAAPRPAGMAVTESGYVSSIRDVAVNGPQHSGVASFTGSILGGLLGSTIGSGTGRAIATVGGAVAGSVAGDRLARASSDGATMTAVSVRMVSGVERVFQVEPDTAMRVGDRVLVTVQDGVAHLARP